MIVATLYDEKNERIKEKVDKLKEYTITSDYLKEYTFKYINKINANRRYDICIILSNEIDQINKYISKIKDLKKCIIVTSVLSTDHVLACINITDNLSYLNSPPNVILEKVIKVYEERNF